MHVKEKKYVHSLSVKFGIGFFPLNKMMHKSMNLSFVIMWVVIPIFFSGVPLKHLSKPNAHKRVEI